MVYCKSSSSKPKHKKGLWSPEEDQRLRNCVLQHGDACWSSVPINAGLQRNGKSCRLRWINYLRPGLKRGVFNMQEEETILTLHRLLGNKWSQIAQQLPGRTDNEIKNYWHCQLKKKLAKLNEEMEAAAAAQDHDATVHPVISENNESSSSSPNNTTRSSPSSCESFHHNAENGCLRPKLLFAEWLSLDHHHHHHGNGSGRSANSCDQVMVTSSKDGTIINNDGNHNQSYSDITQDPNSAYYLSNEGAGFGSDQFSHYGFSNGGDLVDEMLTTSSRFNKFAEDHHHHHHHFSGIGFVDSISGRG